LVVVLDRDNRIAKSDTAVSEQTRTKLVEAVKPLEDVPDFFKDWHPGSDGLVLDLVHPSLFPLVYGESWVLPNKLTTVENCTDWTGTSDVVPNVSIAEADPGSHYGLPKPKSWGHYMWLPSNIGIDDSGKAHIESYINNLHPEHRDLYGILETVLNAAIPLWNEVLSEVPRRRIQVTMTSDDDFIHPEGVLYPGKMWEESESEEPTGLGSNENKDGANTEKEDVNEKNEEDAEDDDEEDDDEDEEDEGNGEDEQNENENENETVEGGDEQGEEGEEEMESWELEEIYKEWKRDQAVINWPDPVGFEATKDLEDCERLDLCKSYSGLQVIFKLANIHLTPDKPIYGGGSWHIEGALNEHIVASAIYYYDEDNISESYLAFRHCVPEDDMLMIPAQNEWHSAEYIFGVEHEGPGIQELGRVLTCQGRLICFPNVVMHQVQPFELQDKTKQGHRKILALFLVNPGIPVLSTANIPPQRRDWWSGAVRQIEPFANLPQEIFNSIMEFVEYPLSWDDAVAIREKLMAERTAINDQGLAYLIVSMIYRIEYC
jgi:hypothetical protein